MNDNDRRRWDMLVRSNQFGIDNAVDFATGIGHAQFTVINGVTSDASVAAAAQIGGIGELAETVMTKATAREDLRAILSAISRTAKSMDYSYPGIADEFRFGSRLSDADFLATGRAFHSGTADKVSDFIAFGLEADFRNELQAACDTFEQTFGPAATAKAEKVAATARITDAIRKGMIAVRTLDAVVRNKYANDPGKLAAWAWASASHVEKPPKKKTTPTPPTP